MAGGWAEPALDGHPPFAEFRTLPTIQTDCKGW